MFIYFVEQIWTDNDTYKWNFETSEMQRQYWDYYRFGSKMCAYPTKYMELDIDYLDF